MTRRFVLLLVLLAAPVPAVGQAEPCTFDRCALRVRHTFWSDQVVRGADGTLVARLGTFAPTIDVLASAGDSAQRHYRAFRSTHTTGNLLLLISGVLGVIATVKMVESANTFEDLNADEWFLLGSSLAFGVAGGITIRAGREHLQQSIWHYNRSLVP